MSTPTLGLVVFDRGLDTDTLSPSGTGTATYTQDGPRPGQPLDEDGVAPTNYRPQVVGAQSVDLALRTLRGGFPGRDGATTLYRLGTDTAAGDWRGWQDPVLVTGWSAPTDGWGSSSAWTTLAATVIPEKGVVVVVALDSATLNAQTWSWDARTATWTTLYDWDAGTLDGLQLPIALGYDAVRGRLILQSNVEGSPGAGFHSHAYYSEDGGATWDIYAEGNGTGDGFTVGTKVDMVPDGDRDWLALGCVVGGFVRQFASSDLGISWDEVSDPINTPGQAALGPAGYVYVCVEDGTDDLVAMLSSSARGALGKVATIDSSRNYSGAWVCADADGTLYAFARGTSGAGLVDALWAWYSTDGGLTWTAYTCQVYNMANNTATFEPQFAVACAGAVHLVGTSTGAAATDKTVQILTLGGWAHVANGVGSEEIHERSERFGWGGASRGNHEAILYFPGMDTPDQHGWTAAAATGAANLSAQPSLRLTTTAGQAQQYSVSASGSNDFASADVGVRVDPSGNVTLATLGTSGGGVGFLVALSLAGGGGHFYGANVDVGTDGFQLRDGSTIRASVTIDTTSQSTRIRVAIRLGEATAWYSRDAGRTWVRWANSVTLTDLGAGVGGDEMLWGNGATQVGKSYWRIVGFATDEDWTYGINTIAEAGDSASSDVLGHQFGGPVPGRGAAYSIPDATAAGEDIGFVTASGGPTHAAERIDLPTAYAHPIAAIDPRRSPSPRRAWQTTTDDAVVIEWDHGADQEAWHGDALALVVLAATPRTWVLEEDDGAGGWTALGTLDLALGTGLKWKRTGALVTPNTATTAVTRYIAEGELVGGTIDLDGKCRRIVGNSAGYWSAVASVQRVRLTLEGIDGTEGATGTAGVLCTPGGVLVVYPTIALNHATRYVRVTVAGSQPTPDGTYGAGLVAVGRVVGFGAVPDWAHTTTHRAARTSTTSSDGVTSIRRLGPPKRIISYGWPDGCPLVAVRAGTAGTVGAAGGHAIAMEDDVPLALPGLIEMGLESGQVPCVLLRKMPTSTGAVTDPALFVYGRATGEIGVSVVVGNEGVDELANVTGMTVEEIR